MFNLNQIINATNTELINQGQTTFSGIDVNAQKDLKGKLFFALKGGGRDTHPLIALAIKNQASGVVLEYGEDELLQAHPDLTIIKSPLSIKSFQDLGAHYRRSLNTTIVGITGSNGKTTVKEFSLQLISNFKKTKATKGNFNNHWGVPLTLLEMPDTTEVGIVEMGMNYPKEIASFVQIARPNIVVCTNVAQAHVEQLGSIANIAKAKEEIYESLLPNDIAIFNVDNMWTRKMLENFNKNYPKNPCFTYSSTDENADVFLRAQSSSVSGLHIEGNIKGHKGKAFIPIFGEHNITNLMAAVAIGIAIGLTSEEIWKALPLCRTPWGRCQIIELKSGAHILFDSYNANPESMSAMINNIKSLPVQGEKIGVFGDMKELGEDTFASHRQLGAQAASAEYKKIFYVGQHGTHFLEGLKDANYHNEFLMDNDINETLATNLSESIRKGDLITIKSSRDLHLERVIPFCQPIDFKFYDPHSL